MNLDLDINQKKLYCQIMAQLMIIDGAVTDDERARLSEVMDRFGLSEAERQDVYNHVNVDDNIEEKVRRLDSDVIEELTRELEVVAGVDGDVSPGEVDIISRIRRALF